MQLEEKLSNLAMVVMADMQTGNNEVKLNTYYNRGGFNHPNRIGSVMAMIRELRPATVRAWREWYVANIHDDIYLDKLADEMWRSIPDDEGVSKEDCWRYINDVMFRRTFDGYNREKRMLTFLREQVSPNVEESPEEWDAAYFVDFYVYSDSGKLIGIQLKPETFYTGKYNTVVDIEGKLAEFRRVFNAGTYVLVYRVDNDSGDISIINQLTLLSLRLAALDMPSATGDDFARPNT